MYLGSLHHPIYPSEIYGRAAANAQQNPTDTYRLVQISVCRKSLVYQNTL